MNEEKLHKLLPIGDNEKILTVVKHHWFAFISVYVGAGFICLIILAAIILIGFAKNELGISDSAMGAIIAVGLVTMLGVAVFSLIPVWIKKEEMLVLTEEALLQIKKPSLFASKVSQLNLQHIADVTVDQDTIGTLFGFAHLTIETPGEQDNYKFSVVGDAREKAKAIIEAHENYAAALESGQIQTTLGARPPTPGSAWRDSPQPPTPQSNPMTPQDWQRQDEQNTPPPQPAAPASPPDTSDQNQQ
jgi:hypothetical protein